MNRSIRFGVLVLFLIMLSSTIHAQVKIGNNPNTIDGSAVLEIEDTTRGALLPRMTEAQRNSISSPSEGLMIYNNDNFTIDVYRNGTWESAKYKDSKDNLVFVYDINDLPSATGGVITLDASKMYVFSGTIDISPNYIDMNGASLRGFRPSTDGVMSNVSGGVLRSTDENVYIEDLVVIPFSSNTKAYDFTDNTGTKFCNLFAGASVVEVGGVNSLGVGQASGFKATTITKNYWSCTDGIKVTGTVGKFTCNTTFIENIGSSGIGIEFLSGLVIDDIDLSNNYFIYSGGTGIKVDASASVDRGRLTTNMFRGVGTYLDGFDPYTIGWMMSQNTNVPNSRAYGYIYMNDNTTSTSTSPNNMYVKVEGTTVNSKLQKFTSPSANRLTYKGKEDITAKVFFTVTGTSPGNGAEFDVALAKNGAVISNPRQSSSVLTNDEAFTIVLETETDMVTDDYVEVFIRTTTNDSPVTITDMQFRVQN